VRAVDGVSLSVERGRTLGLVGESGSGKSTTGLLLLGLLKPSGGRIIFEGETLEELLRRNPRHFRRRAQIVFQNPFASLNPRMTVKDIVGRGMKLHGLVKSDEELAERVAALLLEVGLKEEHLSRYPHEFSGGQRQRIAIARALALNPEFVVLDEPTSALDVSVQAQILNLLKGLQQSRGLSYLFISHNLAVVRHMSHEVAVMYLGKVMESASKDSLFSNPLHPYTQALLKSIPKISFPPEDIEKKVIEGDIPSPVNPPSGCPFNPRCHRAADICRTEMPDFREAMPGHWVACHLV
jgi:oligopeptide/dipeptide ABC transporter ATP-binding protein